VKENDNIDIGFKKWYWLVSVATSTINRPIIALLVVQHSVN